MPDILHLLNIGASPERVFAAVASEDGVRNWWTRDATLGTQAGGVGEFAFYGRKTVTHVTIEELTPPVRVRWRVADSTLASWRGTSVAFDLEPQDGGTVLRFAHRGFAQADDNYARVTTGWGYYLASLKAYLETGKGAPHPDIDFHRMVARDAA